MGGISRLTALEIFANPKDLQACILADRENKRFGIFVTRSTGANIRTLITTELLFRNRSAAILEMQSLLEALGEGAEDVLKNPVNVMFSVSSLNERPFRVLKDFYQRTVAWIIDQLLKGEIADTAMMKLAF